MYKIAIRTFLQNFPIFLIVALLLAGFSFLEMNVQSGGSFFAYGLVALFSHRMILLNENYGWSGKPTLKPGETMPMWAFFWRYGLFFIIFLFLSLAVFLPLMPSDPNDEAKIVGAIILSFLIVAPFYSILLSLFGTVLPAAAVRGERSFSAAFHRGRKRFWITMGRLALGPALIFVAMFMLAIAVPETMNSAILDFASNAVFYLLGLLPTHMTAVVLSMAYSEAEAFQT